MDKYEVVKDLGAGNFGVARLLRHKETKELVAMKYIERGHKVCLVLVLLIIIISIFLIHFLSLFLLRLTSIWIVQFLPFEIFLCTIC